MIFIRMIFIQYEYAYEYRMKILVWCILKTMVGWTEPAAVLHRDLGYHNVAVSLVLIIQHSNHPHDRHRTARGGGDQTK